MEPRDRLEMALTMSEDVKGIARAGIRHRHPDWTEASVQAALSELLLGPELAAKARPTARG